MVPPGGTKTNSDGTRSWDNDGQQLQLAQSGNQGYVLGGLPSDSHENVPDMTNVACPNQCTFVVIVCWKGWLG
jgi:hypothetical protein